MKILLSVQTIISISLTQNGRPKNCLPNLSPNFNQHDESILSLITATQSLIPVDDYGMIGPYSLFREK